MRTSSQHGIILHEVININLETFEGIITINEIEYNFYYNNKFITVFPKDSTSSWNDLEGLFYR